MEIESLFLPATNKFATEYYAGTHEILQYFHYNYQQSDDYRARIDELAGRTFMRNELANHISNFMKSYPSSSKVEESIEKLKAENSVVVIGGQQAGILTGPLYSIHKVISIIVLAKQKEKELGIPVVPVFWIAGEDHDYMEVNHVYLQEEFQLEKWVYPEKVVDKRMVSDVSINKDICLSWVKDVIKTFGETDYTNQLIELSEMAIEKSDTYVDLFAFIIMELFKEDGLLLLDSGNRGLRQLEKEIFLEQIAKTEAITHEVKEQQSILLKNGFQNAIDISENAANIFYYDEENYERILLEFNKSSRTFTGKNGSITFSYDEMLSIASEFPEKLSNNVVTRPVMQEALFPTLAFIAGPGEISYWAELQKVFEGFQMKMPPIVPRINITLLERDIESTLTELNLGLGEVLQSGVTSSRNAFLDSVRNDSFEKCFNEVKDYLKSHYKLIEEKTEQEYRGLIPLLKKNEDVLLSQIGFMERKFEEALEIKHEVSLRKFNRIESSLRPSDGPQERKWNVYYFLNKYGLDFVHQLSNLPYEFDGSHKVVKI